MRLKTVTITGADDTVDPVDLLKLSARYPFVEWGILLSKGAILGGRQGTLRYPTRAWILDELRKANLSTIMNLSLHLCGATSRDVQEGFLDDLLPYIVMGFRRVQLNGFEPRELYRVQCARDCTPLMRRCWRGIISQDRDYASVEFILQSRDLGLVSSTLRTDMDHTSFQDASVLYDPSGGRGLDSTPFDVRASTVPIGLAGGITPENVVAKLEAADRLGYAWIDMESGVRTDDRFDLEKVVHVLEASKRFFERRGDGT